MTGYLEIVFQFWYFIVDEIDDRPRMLLVWHVSSLLHFYETKFFMALVWPWVSHDACYISVTSLVTEKYGTISQLWLSCVQVQDQAFDCDMKRK